MTKQRRYKVLKWIAGVLSTLLISVVALAAYLNYRYAPIITAELKSLVIQSTDSLYHLRVSGIGFNILSGTAHVHDVVLVPDMKVYYALVKKQTAPNNIYRIRLKELTIEHFHPLNFLVNKKLNIDRLLFDRPEVIMINKYLAFNEDRPPRPRTSPFQFISPFTSELSINQVNFKDARFKYYNNNNDTVTVDSVSNLNIVLKDYLIDAHSAEDESRLYLVKDILISFKNYSYLTDDRMYNLSVDRLSFAAAGGKLNIRKFTMKPLFSEMAFGKKAGYAADRFNISMNDINVSGLDLPLYVQRQEIMAKTMDISNGVVSVFTDNSQPKRMIDRTGRFPHQLFQKLKAKITVQKINLKNIDIGYSEYDRDSKQKGIITFRNTFGTITNATNSDKIKAINPLMKADLQTALMGQGTLKVQFNFDISSPRGAFSYTGKLGEMDGRQINRITRPLGMLAVNRSKIDSLYFNVKADDREANGSMAFGFNDLSVSLFKKDATREKLVRLGLMSFLANNLLLVQENPAPGGKINKVNFNYKRPIHSSFFSFIWRTLFVGIKYSVGITPKREQGLQSKIDKFEEYKSSREQRQRTRSIQKKER